MIPSLPNGVLNHGMPAYGYTPYARVGQHHPQIRSGSADPAIEAFVRAHHAALADLALSGAVPGFVDDVSVANALERGLADLARHRDFQFGRLLRLQRHGEHDNAALVAVWLAVPANDRASLDAIEPLVAQHHVIGGRIIDHARAAAFAVRASHLEEVSEIGIEVQRHRRLDRVPRVVREPYPLDAVAVPQRAGAEDVQ